MVLQPFVQLLELQFVVQHRNGVHEAVVNGVGDVLDVGDFFETVADDVVVLFQQPLFLQCLHNVYVKCGGSFNVHVVFEYLLQHKQEMGAFGTIAIVVFPLVVRFCDGHVEPPFRLLDVL